MELEKTENVIDNNLEKLDIKQNNLNNYLATPEKQNNFLETTLGKVINTGLDIGLRWILPDLIENQVIDIKDTLLNNGLKSGIDKAVESGLELGKSAMGIVTGKFDNVNQIQTAIQKGGMLDTISNSINYVLDITTKNGLVPQGVSKIIRNSKNVLLDNIESNIEGNLTNQLRAIEKVDKYTKNWNQAYKSQDFESMQREYEKIKTEIKNLVPLENTLKKAREVENLHLLIKNKGQDFNLSQEEINLAKKLS